MEKSFNKELPLVSVCTVTYNHEKYIAQAIEGVLMQKGNFKVEMIIGEDCSKDSTREIVKDYQRRYPDIIKPILYEKNVGPSQNSINCLNACKGKYIAALEGDDYWTDPLKLQKQVEFLENNPQYAICAHNALVVEESTGNSQLFTDFKADTIEGIYLLNNRILPTASVVFRNREFNFPAWFYSTPFGDTCLFLMVTAYGGLVKFLNQTMSVYRKHPGGIMNTFGSEEYYSRLIDTYNGLNAFLKFKYNRLFQEKVADVYLYKARLAQTQGSRKKALQNLGYNIWFLSKAKRRFGRLHLGLLKSIMFGS